MKLLTHQPPRSWIHAMARGFARADQARLKHEVQNIRIPVDFSDKLHHNPGLQR